MLGLKSIHVNKMVPRSISQTVWIYIWNPAQLFSLLWISLSQTNKVPILHLLILHITDTFQYPIRHLIVISCKVWNPWDWMGGWGCEVACGGHHRPRGKTTTESALDGAVFDIAQILAYLVYNMSRSQLYLGFGHFGWLPSFFGQ